MNYDIQIKVNGVGVVVFSEVRVDDIKVVLDVLKVREKEPQSIEVLLVSEIILEDAEIGVGDCKIVKVIHADEKIIPQKDIEAIV